MRPIVAVVAGAFVTCLGAVILGEYQYEGTTPFLAGGLLGLFLAELVSSIARRGDVYLMAATALLVEACLVWALWISTGHRLDLAAGEAWFGIAFGMAAAAYWVRSAGQRPHRSPARS
jgi:hypothetical protein